MDEFYGTAAAYIAYHVARGRDVAGQTETDIERALLVASEWLDGTFEWPGHKYGQRAVQTRDWPRYDVYDRANDVVDYETVPVEIENATYEIAFRHIADPTILVADYAPNKYDSVSIDGALSVKYRHLDSQGIQKQFPVLSTVLAPLLGGTATSSLSSSMIRV